MNRDSKHVPRPELIVRPPRNLASELAPQEVELVEEAYRRSREMLRSNVCAFGMLASSEKLGANYNAVWGRDGCICAIGALQTDDEELHRLAFRTLETLSGRIADNGQIPSYLLMNDADDAVAQVVYGGLGSVTTIDSNLWFILGVYAAMRRNPSDQLRDELLESCHRTLRHLQSIDADYCGLLEIPLAGDWPGILDRASHILYDELLWDCALQCAAEVLDSEGA